MWMSLAQVQASYRSAKCQNEQILILSQLNNCPIEKIESLLGVKYIKPKRSENKPYCYWNKDTDDITLKELYASGMSHSEIAEAMGTSYSTIRYHCKKLDIWENEK